MKCLKNICLLLITLSTYPVSTENEDVEVKDGKSKTKVRALNLNPLFAFGPNCLVSDAEAISYLIDRCNKSEWIPLNLDMPSLANGRII